jgi:hypothetical protein
MMVKLPAWFPLSSSVALAAINAYLQHGGKDVAVGSVSLLMVVCTVLSYFQTSPGDAKKLAAMKKDGGQ